MITFIILEFMRVTELKINENINTFTSQRLVSEEKNEPFLLENASNLTHEFLYNNLTRYIQNFFGKIVIQKCMCQI